MKRKLPWRTSAKQQPPRKLLKQPPRPSTHGRQMLGSSPPTTPDTPLPNPRSYILMWLPWVVISPPYLAGFPHRHSLRSSPPPQALTELGWGCHMMSA